MNKNNSKKKSYLRIMINNHAARAVESLRLMNKHIASSVIRIVGHTESFRNFSILSICVQRFNNLRGLRSWRSAHVKYRAVRFYVEKQRWNHRNELLPSNMARLTLSDHPLMEARKLGKLTKLLPTEIRLPGEPVRVPR